jgi:hypothetical protein
MNYEKDEHKGSLFGIIGGHFTCIITSYSNTKNTP